MARSEAHRKYQLTVNNPLEHGFTHEVIKTTLAGFENCVYWCISDEIAESGTPHTHVYIVFQSPVMFSTLHTRFYGAHIEPARGSNQENRDYILKEGKWVDDEKHETSIADTFEESGELPEENTKRQTDSETILAMIEAGSSNADIIREFPTAMNRLQHIEKTRQTLLEEKYRREFRKLYVEYIWGKTGVGKTRRIMEKHGYDKVYRVTNYAHPFDEYKGESVILFDEFRSSLPISDMLKYLDGYPLMLPCRFNDRVACYAEVYVISNIPMEKQYSNIQLTESETWSAWLRRFDITYQLMPSSADVPF